MAAKAWMPFSSAVSITVASGSVGVSPIWSEKQPMTCDEMTEGRRARSLTLLVERHRGLPGKREDPRTDFGDVLVAALQSAGSGSVRDCWSSQSQMGLNALQLGLKGSGDNRSRWL